MSNRTRRRNTKKLLTNRDRRWKCHYCQKSVPVDQRVAEHAVPLSRGGSDRMENIVMSCRQCDHWKGPLTAGEFLAVKDDHAARKALIAVVHQRLKANQQ